MVTPDIYNNLIDDSDNERKLNVRKTRDTRD